MTLFFLWLLLIGIAWLVQAWLSVVLARKFARRLERKPRRGLDWYRPRAHVVVPFKDIDNDLPGCVRSLCRQDYPSYELLLVVESQSDAAYEVLRRELARYPDCEAQVLVAGEAPACQGQKVHNQIVAIDQINPRSADEDAWVFADSDAVPDDQWLTCMISPLAQDNLTAVTTGYRWLVPDCGGTRAVWPSLLSVFNASSACLLSSRRFVYAWGGSMAMRTSTARRGDLRGRLTGALTDDYCVSRMCEDLQRRVYFVGTCLVATPVSMTLSESVNFLYRQYLLTRVYEPRLFMAALGVTTLFVVGWISILAGLVMGAIGAAPREMFWWALGVSTGVFVAHQFRAGFRSRALHGIFDPPLLHRLRWPLFIDRWLTPIWMGLHWAVILRSAFGRTMEWRGIRYRLNGPHRVLRLSPS